MAQNNSQQDYNQSKPLGNFNEAKAPNKFDVQQRLEELEAQVYQTTKETTPPYAETESSFLQKITNGMNVFRNWFNKLPQAGKLIVGIVVVLMGFSILNLFVRLIANLITLAILSLILYGLYKYLFSPSQTK
ncbi:MAG: hypothetical protein QNJ65_07270 [Xenococcaceae cyanobacterium MO_234.B1]|nr:hypothetical protein [Xenococcaceae cyanobacterium MO_234.B1]